MLLKRPKKGKGEVAHVVFYNNFFLMYLLLLLLVLFSEAKCSGVLYWSPSDQFNFHSFPYLWYRICFQVRDNGAPVLY